MDEKPEPRPEPTPERVDEINRRLRAQDRSVPKRYDGEGIPPLDLESDDYAAKPA